MSARRKPTAGPEARRLAYERQQAELAAVRQATTLRLIDKFKTEPDREYADEMWGSMLRDRGIDTETL